MKTIQVVPKVDIESKLKTLLKQTERSLRGGSTTFHRQREGRWKHIRYPGWIKWGASIPVSQVRVCLMNSNDYSPIPSGRA